MDKDEESEERRDYERRMILEGNERCSGKDGQGRRSRKASGGS